MREILFRGKRVDNGEWFYGDILHNSNCVKIRENETDIDYIARSYQIIPETLGQYTGLKDAHGTRIFEGDIVACNQSGSYGMSVIIYDNSAFYVMPLNGNILERTLWDYWYNDWDIEVISNIHDSPELLKGGAENE